MSMEVEKNSGSRAGSLLVNNSSFRSQNQPSELPRSRPSKRFRGVLWIKTFKWGARISFKHKPYWLGTYEVEEEAAMAYDRAAIKLQRGYAPLNFPTTVYTAQETKFLSRFSDKEILDMLRGKTYLSKFTDYLRKQSLGGECQASHLANQQGVLRQMFFQKELTQSDITQIRAFHIPKEYARKYFPPIESMQDGNGSRSVELTFYDKHYCPWTFRYSYWKSSETFVFTRGWRHFLGMNNLNPKDIVFFYRCEYIEEYQGKDFYMIDVHRHSAQHSVVGSNGEEEIAAREKRSNEGDTDDMEEGAHNEVKLFGVQIGKRKIRS